MQRYSSLFAQQVAQRRRLARLPQRVRHEVALRQNRPQDLVEIEPLKRRNTVVLGRKPPAWRRPPGDPDRHRGAGRMSLPEQVAQPFGELLAKGNFGFQIAHADRRADSLGVLARGEPSIEIRLGDLTGLELALGFGN